MVRETVFQKLGEAKATLQRHSKISEKEFPKIISRLGNWFYKKNFPLSRQELKALEVLVSHKFNPYTVYRWHLLTQSSDEVKAQLMRGLIGQKRASKKNQSYKNMYSVEEKDIHRAVLDLVERYIVR
ncbi:MAG: hypothetical protein KJ984_02855 [Nanoarchaeota archaeon]|nr:hypothetical protein [Nanoarchaeota archaeon]